MVVCCCSVSFVYPVVVLVIMAKLEFILAMSEVFNAEKVNNHPTSFVNLINITNS